MTGHCLSNRGEEFLCRLIGLLLDLKQNVREGYVGARLREIRDELLHYEPVLPAGAGEILTGIVLQAAQHWRVLQHRGLDNPDSAYDALQHELGKAMNFIGDNAWWHEHRAETPRE